MLIWRFWTMEPKYASPGFAGTDATTDVNGEVNWIVVTDRIYAMNSMATENITDAQVAEGARVFINNPRPVDMSSSHQEVFVEFGADMEPPEIHNVLLDGMKFRTVAPGAVVGLAATLDDSATGNSDISSANWTIGMANWPSSSPMFPLVPPYDFPVEDVVDGIDTTLWIPGSYEIWVYGCDALLNCNTTGDFATLNITGLIDNEPPEILNVSVNGLPSVTVLAGALVDITAVVYDNLTGNSVILNGNYTIGQDNWPSSTPMNPTDGAFDDTSEDVDEVIDTTGWFVGSYDIWVYGCDVVPNCNTTGDFATINIVLENQPPEINFVSVNGLLAVDVPAGTIVTLNATVDDRFTGNSMISGANYTMGFAAWPGVGMFAVDGTWDDDARENVTVQVDTTGWNCAAFDLYVYGWDSVPNYNTTSTAYATINITVCDFQPPEIYNVFIDGAPSQTYQLSVLPATFTLTGLIDDEATGGTPIGGANYTRPAAAWPGTPMNPADGAFDTRVETANITLPTPTTPGTYQYCVYGWDQIIPPNYNTTGSCAALTIVDDIMPNVWNVFLNGGPSVSVPAGTLVDLDADIDDSVTGGSNIWDAYWSEFPPVWPGTAMNPTDLAFDSQTEGVNATIDTTGWTPGDHIICVNARDVQDNRNTTCMNNATLTITTGVDTTPPTATGSPTGTGVSITTNITIQFDEPMDTGSADASFSYTDLTTTWDSADGVLAWSNGDQTMTFNPTTDLGYSTTYLVTLNGSVAMDLAGNPLDGNGDGTGGDNYTFSFQTEDQPPVVDTTPPSVIGTTPDDEDTDVAVDIPVIEVEFDEDMNEAVIDVDLDGISTDESWDGNTLIITPLEDMDYDTEYTVTITNAEDLAGNSMETYTFTFTTEAEPDTPVPDGDEVDLTWLWLLLIVLAIVIGLLLFLLLRKKKPAEEEFIAPEQPVEPIEEPVGELEEEVPPCWRARGRSSPTHR
jgi:hypothetical protein